MDYPADPLCIEKYTVVTEIVDVIVRMIDVTRDPFHLQDVGICELSIKNQNILEIVMFPEPNSNVDLNKIHVESHALKFERLNQLL